MKKLIYLCAILAASAFCLTACDNDVEGYDVTINPTTPDLAASGIYEGTWTRMLLTDSTTTEAEGQIVIETDTAYLVDVHFLSGDFNLDKSVIANITYANDGFIYFNNMSNTDLKTSFVGRIDGERVNTVSFTISQVENRRVKKFQYTFSGRKTE